MMQHVRTMQTHMAAAWPLRCYGIMRVCVCVCVLPTDEKAVNQLQEVQVKLDDFKKVKLIGRGAFGEVQLVRCSSP